MTSVKGSSLILSDVPESNCLQIFTLRGGRQENGHCSADRQGYCPRPATFVGLQRRVSWPTAQLDESVSLRACMHFFGNMYVSSMYRHAFFSRVLHLWFVHLEDGKNLSLLLGI